MKSEMRLAATKKAVRKRLLSGGIEAIIEEFSSLHVEKEDLERRLEAQERAIKMLQLPIVDDVVDTIALPPSAVVDADSLLEGAGFHELEYNDAGQPFRWTGPGGKFSLIAYVDRSIDKLATLELLPQEGSARLVAERLRVTVDGKEVNSRFNEAAAVHEIQFKLAPMQGRAATAIVFHQSVWSPAGGDERLLGVAFRRLIVSDI